MTGRVGSFTDIFDCLTARILDALFAGGDRPVTLERLAELTGYPMDEVEKEIARLGGKGIIVERGRFLRDGIEERELSEKKRYVLILNLNNDAVAALSKAWVALSDAVE